MDRGVNLNEKEILIQLQRCEAEISELQYQLEQQQNLKSSLEQKLATIRGLMAPTTPVTPVLPLHSRPSVPPVARIPKEIYFIIFSELIRNDPLAIGPLLLVCRHWNEVICNSPLLWSRISAYLAPHPLDIKRWAEYVVASIRYSGNVPLDVDITLPSLYDFWSLISLKLLDLSPQFKYADGWTIANKGAGSMELTGHIEDIENWFNNAYDTSTTPFPLVEQANSAISDGMILISDATSSHLFRLRSLKLRFHSGDFTDCLRNSATRLFPIASTPREIVTPMLEELVIVDQGYGFDPEDNTFSHPIPSLIRLSWGVNWPVTAVLDPAFLGRLTHLRLLVQQDLPSSEYTYNITQLFLDWSLCDPEYNQREQNLYFPQLEDLTLFGLSGPCPIKAPCLTTLRLVDGITCGLMLDYLPNFPSLAKLHVWASVDGLRNLQVCIGQLPLLKEVAFLYFSSEYSNNLRDLVRDDRISVKSYLYSPGNDHWRFTSYEHDDNASN